MAAKDYVFVTGWRDAYLAKKRKSNSPTMNTYRTLRVLSPEVSQRDRERFCYYHKFGW